MRDKLARHGLPSLSRKIGVLLRDGFSQWWDHNAFQLAAALAYYTVFSLTPLLIIAIAIAAIVFGQDAAQNQIVGGLTELIGEASAQAIKDTIRATSMNQQNFLAALIGTAVFVLGAAGVVGQLQQSLNLIWSVKVRSSTSWRNLIRDRLCSFALILAIGFLLLVSLIVTTILSALTAYFSEFHLGGIWRAIDTVVSFFFVTVLFALIYKILPDVQLTWRDVTIGAIVTSLFFTVGKYGIGLYLGHATFASTYGAAGSIVTLLIWVYYSALIFFYGAEVTQVYATKYGNGVVPTLLANKTANPKGATSPGNNPAS